MNILKFFKKPAPAPKTVESITASVVTMVEELEALAAHHEVSEDAAHAEIERQRELAVNHRAGFNKAMTTASKFRALVN